ncbi:MAG: hypothetical protein J6Q22_10780 [Prevotella sp.]|nr:hypothetical protein [Prevotella sp.]
MPKEKSLEEHDKEKHPHGFNPETDTCKFRERLSKETESDKADELDTGKDDEFSDEEIASMEKIFGVTDDIDAGGWLLPDGRLLDFNRDYHKDGKEDWDEHGDISKAFSTNRKKKLGISGAEKRIDGLMKGIEGAMQAGGIRYDNGPDGLYMDIGKEPTKEQYGFLEKMARHDWDKDPFSDGDGHVITIGGNKKVLTYPDNEILRKRLVSDIKKFFTDEGRENKNSPDAEAVRMFHGDRFSKKSDGGEGWLKEALEAVAKKVKRFISGVKVQVSDKPYDGGDERKNGASISRDALEKAINRIFDEGIVDIRVKDGQREKIVKSALGFFDKYGEAEFPISTGGIMFFGPAPETIKRHGGNEELAWAEYAIHAATNDNVDEKGKHYRTYGKEKIEKVNPRIEEIVSADETIIDRNRAVFFKEIDENHVGRLVARPENGDLRVDDLMEVTATYMKKKNAPDTTMPLVRAVEEWTSRGDTTNSSTDADSIANLGSGANGGEERKSISANPDIRYFRDDGGKVVGTYNRKTNKVVLYPGANADTIAHELCGHATWQYAEQQAANGDSSLLDKMNEVVDAEIAKPVWEEVAANYGGESHDVQREEVWAHIVGHKGSKAIAKIRDTEKGQKWYQKAWGVVKDAWKGMLSKVGLNRIKTDGIEKMSPEEFSDFMVEQMTSGKTLGEIKNRKDEKDEKDRKSITSQKLVTPKEDAAYKEAVEKGDMETAAKMVREVAGRAFPNTKVVEEDGLPKIVFHNTDSSWTVPVVPWEGPIEWDGLPGLFFADKEQPQYGKNRISCFVNLINPLDMNDGGRKFLHGRSSDQIDAFTKQYEDAIKTGENEFEFGDDGVLKITPKGMSLLKYDGYFGEHPEDETGKVVEYAVMSATQVKSAAPVTYDDSGKVVPLSRRFDDGDDIRGDVSGTSSFIDMMKSLHPDVNPDELLSKLKSLGSREEMERAVAQILGAKKK